MASAMVNLLCKLIVVSGVQVFESLVRHATKVKITRPGRLIIVFSTSTTLLEYAS